MKNKIRIWADTNLLYEEEDVQYELSAMMYVDKDRFGKYTMPSLSFWKNKGMANEKIIETYDNEEYLYETLFLNVLKPHKQGRKEDISIKEMNDLLAIRGVQMKHLKGIYKLLKKGVELGFFDELARNQLKMHGHD